MVSKQIKHTDFLGNPLEVGDKVAYACNRWGDGYYLGTGTVTGSTPCFIKIEEDERRDWESDIKKTPEKVIKLPRRRL